MSSDRRIATPSDARCHPLAAALAAFALVALSTPAFAEGHGHAPHWSYRGDTGPTHWRSLETAFAACGVGREQSPIDIRSTAVQKSDLPAIRFAYQPGPLKIIDNGHTVQVNVAPGSTIEVGGRRFELVQFHFHRPSEEAIDGRHQDMVAHLVHKDAEGRLGVVAVLLKAGAINPAVASLWNNLPSHKEVEVAVPGVTIDPADLLPADRAYFTFAGSLTTPPCSEGVTWFVLKHPTTLSTGEIERFARLYPNNARPVQPLNGRVVRASP
jgi:carbonic anhydrase